MASSGMSVARIAAARFRISGDARMIDSLREDVSRHPNDFVSSLFQPPGTHHQGQRANVWIVLALLTMLNNAQMTNVRGQEDHQSMHSSSARECLWQPTQRLVERRSSCCAERR